MTLRITDDEQLKHLGPHARKQVEKALKDPFHGKTLGDIADRVESRPTRPSASRIRYQEEEAGRQLIKWIDAWNYHDPVLGDICVGDYFVHTPNGGARSKTEAAIFKGQGVRAGWPDYTLYLPRCGWHGAVLELKADDGQAPDSGQLEVLYRLQRAGYRPIVAWGFEYARHELREYVMLPVK